MPAASSAEKLSASTSVERTPIRTRSSRFADVYKRQDVDFAACYEHLLADKKRMREAIPPLLTAQLPETPDDPEERLCTCCLLYTSRCV